MSHHQPSMFEQTPHGLVPKVDAVPASHAADPQTSKVAEASHTASGKRHRNADLVLKLVRENPCRTGAELFELANDLQKKQLVEMQEVRRRLTDLTHIGAVRVVEERACGVKKNLAGCYEAVE